MDVKGPPRACSTLPACVALCACVREPMIGGVRALLASVRYLLLSASFCIALSSLIIIAIIVIIAVTVIVGVDVPIAV